MGSGDGLAWASNLLGLELHRLDQVPTQGCFSCVMLILLSCQLITGFALLQLQSGAVYLLILDAFHANCVALSKVME